MAEIERLKRKALSRGVNLTSQHEDVPAEDVARLRAVFALADSTGAGFINVNELQALHQHLGEPLTDEEAQDAFRRIDVNHSNDISFDDFLSWFTLAHSRSGMLSKKGQAYNQRFKKLMARIEGAFDLKNLSVSSAGAPNTLEFRLNFHYNDNGVLKRISPWHDIPLYTQVRSRARCANTPSRACRVPSAPARAGSLSRFRLQRHSSNRAPPASPTSQDGNFHFICEVRPPAAAPSALWAPRSTRCCCARLFGAAGLCSSAPVSTRRQGRALGLGSSAR
jgi:hypothetical protein